MTLPRRGLLALLSGAILGGSLPREAASRPRPFPRLTRLPTVRDLEAQLHLVPGGVLPRQVQGEDGQIYNVVYVGGEARGGGLYTAELRLERREA